MFKPSNKIRRFYLLILVFVLSFSACADQSSTTLTASNTSIYTSPSAVASRLPSLNLIYATPSLPGHTDAINAVAFSPDGKVLASASNDNTIRLWSVAEAKELRTLKGHTDYVTTVAFSPDGKTLASGSDDNTVRVWSTSTGQEIAKLPQEREYFPNYVAFDLTGKTLVTLNTFAPDVYNLWSVGNWQKFASFDADSDDGGAVTFDSTGQALAFRTNKGKISLIPLQNGQPATNFSINARIYYQIKEYPLAFSPDGKSFAGADGDKKGVIHLWSKLDGHELETIQIPAKTISRLVFSPDSKMLAFATDAQEIKLWSMLDNKEVSTFKTASLYPPIAFSPDIKQLVWGEANGTLKFWSVIDGKELMTIGGKQHNVNAVAFSPDNQILATGTGDGLVKLTSVPDHKELRLIKAHPGKTNTLAFAPDGKTIASGGDENLIKFWSTESGKQVGEIKTTSKQIFTLVFSSDGKYLASIGEDKHADLQIWSVRTGQMVNEARGATDFHIQAVTFSPDSQTIAYDASFGTSAESGLWLVDLNGSLEPFLTQQEDGPTPEIYHLGKQDATTAVTYSSDGKLLASAYGYGFYDMHEQVWKVGFDIWAVGNRQRISGQDNLDYPMEWLAFSPDGQMLVTAGTDRIIRLWGVQSGQELFHTNLQQTYGLLSIALSKDGKYLASGHRDGSIKLWEIKPGLLKSS